MTLGREIQTQGTAKACELAGLLSPTSHQNSLCKPALLRCRLSEVTWLHEDGTEPLSSALVALSRLEVVSFRAMPSQGGEQPVLSGSFA